MQNLRSVCCYRNATLFRIRFIRLSSIEADGSWNESKLFWNKRLKFEVEASIIHINMLKILVRYQSKTFLRSTIF